MTICPHTIRVIEDWAGTKAQNSTKNYNSRHHAFTPQSTFDRTTGPGFAKAFRSKSTLANLNEDKKKTEQSPRVDLNGNPGFATDPIKHGS